MSQQEIYDELKQADNSKLWSIASELNSLRKKDKKIKDNTVDLEDKVTLRKNVLNHLYTESSRGNAQASDKLAKLAGLSESTADIIIESVDFANAKWK
tara:strand:+ start:936 stop:1229 length:294 start_codon:yes stop_codon:yes gene_type:complete